MQIKLRPLFCALCCWIYLYLILLLLLFMLLMLQRFSSFFCCVSLASRILKIIVLLTVAYKSSFSSVSGERVPDFRFNFGHAYAPARSRQRCSHAAFQHQSDFTTTRAHTYRYLCACNLLSSVSGLKPALCKH